jgi:ubiquinone/menaquinone biosynthesis C-methylase UbiE
MPEVDYDSVAPAFDRRYARNSYRGVERAVRNFVGTERVHAILEIGCGTGHWLSAIEGEARLVVGIDPSWQMLDRARTAAQDALLVRGRAEQLPFAPGTFDRAFCVNALHHFTDREEFARECRRILQPGGSFLTIGLDPHMSVNTWWVYDYFPGALAADLRRYPSAERIRDLLVSSGFDGVTTEVVQHVPTERPFELALEQGLLDRRSTSQLMVISDLEFEEGLERLHRDRPVLRSDVRLMGTTARGSPWQEKR